MAQNAQKLLNGTVAANGPAKRMPERVVREPEHAPIDGRLGLMLLAWLGVFAGPLALMSLIALPIAILSIGTALNDPVVQCVGAVVLVVHVMAVLTFARAEEASSRGRRLVAVDARDAPALHTLINQLAKRLDAPNMQRVLIGTELNAAASQHRVAFGLGGTRHELVIGLPLLQSLTHDELSAVLLHELAHSRRSDGRLHTLVFQARRQCLRIERITAEGRFVGRGILSAAARVYLRILTRRSRQVLRDGEFVADAIAAEVAGAHVLARAIVRVTQARDGLNHLWDSFWLGNVVSARPQCGPWLRFARELPAVCLPRRPETYQFSSGYHPSMMQRLERLGIAHPNSVELQYPVVQPAMALLGTAGKRIVNHFDEYWWEDNQARWTDFYRGIPKQRARLELLDRAAKVNDLSEATAIERAMRAEYLLGAEASIERYRWCLNAFPSSAVARYNLEELLKHTAH